MRRIGLAVVLAVGLTFAPLAEAQRVPEVGVLVLGTERLSLTSERGLRELRDALRGFGWIDGESITRKPRFADLSAERLAALAQELVHQRVDIIVSIGTPATAAARRATTSIPIVMSASADPIAAGFVSNLARPDGNVTGTSLLLTETAGKRLQLLKDVTPRLTRTAVLHSGGRISPQLDEMRATAPRLGVELQDFVYRGLDALPAQFAQMRAGRAESLVVVAAQPSTRPGRRSPSSRSSSACRPSSRFVST